MGNCCEERRSGPPVLHSKSRPRHPTSESSLHRGSTSAPQDSFRAVKPERKRKKHRTEAAEPNTELLADVIRRLGSRQELPVGKQTHTWVGAVKRDDAAAAMVLVTLLQSSEFAESPVIRQTYYRLIAHTSVLQPIVDGLASDIKSVRRAFAFLLEALLHVFEGLTIELVMDFLKLNILSSLSVAMSAEDSLEFRLSLATSLRRMFANNPVVQKRLVMPGNRGLMGSVVQLLEEARDPVQIIALATYLREFAVHPDDSLLIENWEVLVQYNVQEKVRKSKARVSLWSGKNSEERDKAIEALQRIEEIEAE